MFILFNVIYGISFQKIMLNVWLGTSCRSIVGQKERKLHHLHHFGMRSFTVSGLRIILQTGTLSDVAYPVYFQHWWVLMMGEKILREAVKLGRE